MVLKFDGVFKCRVEFRAPHLDLLFLRTTDRLSDGALDAPDSYPLVFQELPLLGTAVGFLSTIEIPSNGTEPERMDVFSATSVAALDRDPLRLILSGGLIQKGASGGPVFKPDGQLVGILTNIWQFPLALGRQLPQIITVPLASPVYPVREVIQRMQAQTWVSPE
jgi:hypothetical protein